MLDELLMAAVPVGIMLAALVCVPIAIPPILLGAMLEVTLMTMLDCMSIALMFAD